MPESEAKEKKSSPPATPAPATKKGKTESSPGINPPSMGENKGSGSTWKSSRPTLAPKPSRPAPKPPSPSTGPKPPSQPKAQTEKQTSGEGGAPGSKPATPAAKPKTEGAAPPRPTAPKPKTPAPPLRRRDASPDPTPRDQFGKSKSMMGPAPFKTDSDDGGLRLLEYEMMDAWRGEEGEQSSIRGRGKFRVADGETVLGGRLDGNLKGKEFWTEFTVADHKLSFEEVEELEVDYKNLIDEKFEAKLEGLQMTDGKFSVNSLLLEKDSPEGEFEADDNDWASFKLPVKTSRKKFTNLTYSGKRYSGAAGPEMEGKWKIEDFLGHFNGEYDMDSGEVSLGGSVDLPPGEDNLFGDSAEITLFEVPLPPPATFISFYGKLEPELGFGMEFKISGAKSGGFAPMKNGDTLKLGGEVQFKGHIGIGFAAGVNVGIPYVAGGFAELFAKLGLAGKDKGEDDFSFTTSVESKMVKDQGKMKLAEDLKIKIADVNAALKGSVGFKTGLHFLIWKVKLFEKTFKEWNLASLDFNAEIAKKKDSINWKDGWEFGDSMFSLKGFGKEFTKRHTASNHLRLELDQQAEYTKSKDKYERAKKALDGLESLAIDPADIQGTAEAVKAVRVEYIEALVQALTNLHKLEAEIKEEMARITGKTQALGSLSAKHGARLAKLEAAKKAGKSDSDIFQEYTATAKDYERRFGSDFEREELEKMKKSFTDLEKYEEGRVVFYRAEKNEAERKKHERRLATIRQWHQRGISDEEIFQQYREMVGGWGKTGFESHAETEAKVRANTRLVNYENIKKYETGRQQHYEQMRVDLQKPLMDMEENANELTKMVEESKKVLQDIERVLQNPEKALETRGHLFGQVLDDGLKEDTIKAKSQEAKFKFGKPAMKQKRDEAMLAIERVKKEKTD